MSKICKNYLKQALLIAMGFLLKAPIHLCDIGPFPLIPTHLTEEPKAEQQVALQEIYLWNILKS